VGRLEHVAERVKLDDGERTLLTCWCDARHPDVGVLIATDSRLVVAEAEGIGAGNVIQNVEYSEITAVDGRYLGPISSLLRFLYGSVDLIVRRSARPYEEPMPRVAIDTPRAPQPRGRLTYTVPATFECAVPPRLARRLLVLLAMKTDVCVPRHWVDRLPGLRALVLRAAHPRRSSARPG